MMDELYGLHSTLDYSMQQAPENMVTWTNYQNISSPLVTFADRHPVYGSEQLGSGSSAISDAASMVPEIQRNGSDEQAAVSSAIRAKIASHPFYPKLLEAYIDCQKVGAPPEIALVLDEIRRESDGSKRNNVVSSCLGADPELDEFMVTYCDILMRYKSDLSKPFDEAAAFINNMETQLSNLCTGSDEGVGSSDEDFSGGEPETEVPECSRTSPVDRELKDKLFRKYGGYISTLKHEFSKKKKKGKLPKEARQVLFDWWSVHCKWPYPTESDKVALAESTGLDQRQINNWFINQRKRHWKPAENMQFTVMDRLYAPFYRND